MVMSALLTKHGNKAGIRGKSHAKAKLKCMHCERTGHVEATCWAKHPELKSKANKAASQSKLAFSVSTPIVHEARIGGNDDGKNGESPEHWILDSGATEHFTPHRHLYKTYEELKEPVDVITAKGNLHGIGIGAIEVTLEGAGGKHVTVTLENVLHAPGMDSNLLSSNVLLKRGFEISMHPTKGTNILYDGEIIAKTVPYGGLSRLKTVDTDETAAYKAKGQEPKEKSTPKLPYDVWHRRFAHLGPWNLIKVEKMVDGMRIDEATLPKDELCEACIKGSQTRDLNDKPMRRRTVPGDLIHSDLCGPITPLSTGENLYFVTFIDDATRMTYLCTLKTKTSKEVREAFVEFKNVFEQDRRRIRSLRTDGGGEYEKEIRRLMREHGIKHEVTPPYTPEQNGVAERANRTICERVRAILIETGLPKHLWGELVHTVAYLKNRSPTRVLDGKTPYEALYGKKPDVSHLVAIGTKAFVHITKKKTKKMDPRSKEGIMVGYGGEHIYRVWDPDSTNVWASRDVRFIGEARNPDAKPEVKEKVVYDTIEVLPLPKARKNIANRDAESEMESENEDHESQEASEVDSDENDENEDVSTIPRDSVESDIYVSAPASPEATEPVRDRISVRESK